MTRMGFNERVGRHEHAKEFVKQAFADHGFLWHDFGGELAPELQRVLWFFGDDVSRMLRYRPDGVVVHPIEGSLLVEIKSATPEHANFNFAVEVDAWIAARLWNQTGRRVLYVFVDPEWRDIRACWPDDLYPYEIFVVRAHDFERILAMGLSNVRVRCRPDVRGSGTPYFLIERDGLRPLDDVLMGWREDHHRRVVGE